MAPKWTLLCTSVSLCETQGHIIINHDVSILKVRTAHQKGRNREGREGPEQSQAEELLCLQTSHTHTLPNHKGDKHGAGESQIGHRAAERQTQTWATLGESPTARYQRLHQEGTAQLIPQPPGLSLRRVPG